MMTRMMTMMTVLVAGTATAAHADTFAALDQALPKRDVDVLAIAPVFDFDGDSCLPSAGISRTGQQNGGLNPTGNVTAGCRWGNFLQSSNTVHRYACVNSGGAKYCGHFFALYFLKDQILNGIKSGHRHDWEYAALWTKNGVVTHGSVSAHGKLTTVAAPQLPFEGGHLKVVYHKDGAGTHAFRFAKASEAAENPYKRWVTPPIISWYEFSGDNLKNGDIRPRLNGFGYGNANLPTRDSEFVSDLNRFKPGEYPQFSPESASPPAGTTAQASAKCRAGQRCGAQASVKPQATRSRGEPAKPRGH